MNMAVFVGRNEIIVLPVVDGAPSGAEEWFERGGRKYCDYDIEIVDVSEGFSVRSGIDLDDYIYSPSAQKDVSNWYDVKLIKEEEKEAVSEDEDIVVYEPEELVREDTAYKDDRIRVVRKVTRDW